MPLAAMGEITRPARDTGRGVGAFNVIGVEHAEAIVTGAEAVRAPVVLQISENCAAYHGALDPIARACLAIAVLGFLVTLLGCWLNIVRTCTGEVCVRSSMREPSGFGGK